MTAALKAIYGASETDGQVAGALKTAGFGAADVAAALKLNYGGRERELIEHALNN